MSKPHVHHWLIEQVDEKFIGQCKCRAKREFQGRWNAPGPLDGYAWNAQGFTGPRLPRRIVEDDFDV